MIEKLDNILLASKRDTQDKINEIIDWINEVEGLTTRLANNLESVERFLVRQGKDNEACVSPRTISQTSQPAVCECGHKEESHFGDEITYGCNEDICSCTEFKERGEG